jgi:pimeloyl-ACP methyl ester carboxylesterase
MVEPKIGFCTNPGGIRIAYATFGQGPAVVCAIDFGFSLKDLKQFPTLMRSLEKGGRYHTIALYDHSGTGLSGRDRTDFTLDASASDLKTVIDHLKLEKAILFGMCGGGPIAMAYAAKYPQNITHLVLLNTSAV